MSFMFRLKASTVSPKSTRNSEFGVRNSIILFVLVPTHLEIELRDEDDFSIWIRISYQLFQTILRKYTVIYHQFFHTAMGLITEDYFSMKRKRQLRRYMRPYKNIFSNWKKQHVIQQYIWLLNRQQKTQELRFITDVISFWVTEHLNIWAWWRMCH